MPRLQHTRQRKRSKDRPRRQESRPLIRPNRQFTRYQIMRQSISQWKRDLHPIRPVPRLNPRHSICHHRHRYDTTRPTSHYTSTSTSRRKPHGRERYPKQKQPRPSSINEGREQVQQVKQHIRPIHQARSHVSFQDIFNSSPNSQPIAANGNLIRHLSRQLQQTRHARRRHNHDSRQTKHHGSKGYTWHHQHFTTHR